MDEAGELLVRLQSEPVEDVTVERKPPRQPARAVAEGGGRSDDVHRARARGQFLLPWRHLGMRPGKTDHANHQWCIREPALLDIDLVRRGVRIFLRDHLCDDLAGTNARVAFEHDEAPRRQLAVIGHPRADGEDGFKFRWRRTGTAHLARFYRAADFQEVDGVGHRGLFLGNDLGSHSMRCRRPRGPHELFRLIVTRDYCLRLAGAAGVPGTQLMLPIVLGPYWTKPVTVVGVCGA